MCLKLLKSPNYLHPQLERGIQILKCNFYSIILKVTVVTELHTQYKH